jgi:hypothetical protein
VPVVAGLQTLFRLFVPPFVAVGLQALSFPCHDGVKSDGAMH